MGVIVGVVVGYLFGTRAGEQGWTELEDAWKVIASSEEVRDLVATGWSTARELLGRGGKALFAGGGTGEGDDALRRVA
jgi:hypothetical protein